MEIEKKRETSWNIQLRKKEERIRLTSVEISGEIRLVKFSLLNSNNSIEVEMDREEFFNFLSLLSAFKDVVIGEDTFQTESGEFDLRVDENKDERKNLKEEQEFTEENINKNEEGLDPRDWDPW
jgi:hypothetical protein